MKMKLSIAVVAVLTLTAQAMQSPLRLPHNEQEALNRAIALSLQNQYNAVPQRPVQIQQQDDDMQRALELSAQEYEREVASREAPVAQQEKEELEEAQRLSIKKLNEEFVNAVKNRAVVADIQEFLDQGADIEACDSDGVTSLMWAARIGFIDAVNQLIKAGATIETRDMDGRTALMHATAKENSGCLTRLLDQGADIEAVDSDGLTSLIWAARIGFLDIVNQLIKAGANIEARDRWDQTALTYAAARRHTGCLIALLGQGANSEAVDNKKETPLHRVSGNGSIECMKVLIEYGVNIDAQDEKGNTPLARAVMNNKKNASELLINSGANALLPNYRGVAPFEEAMTKPRRSLNFPLCIVLTNSGVPFKRHFLSFAAILNSIDLARAIMSNIWLLCPSEQDMNTRYARLKTGLLCINRASDSPLPKDVRRLILCSDSELAMDLVLVFYYRLCKGDALNKFQLNLLKQRVPEYMMNHLKSHLKSRSFLEMASYDVRGKPEFISIFNPSALESNFGQAIRTNVINRLNALQHKALTNNETKENK